MVKKGIIIITDKINFKYQVVVREESIFVVSKQLAEITNDCCLRNGQHDMQKYNYIEIEGVLVIVKDKQPCKAEVVGEIATIIKLI